MQRNTLLILRRCLGLAQGPHSASLHTTACVLKGGGGKRKTQSSSKRLVKSLRDVSPAGKFELGRPTQKQKQRQKTPASAPARRQSQPEARYAPHDIDQQPVPSAPWSELTKQRKSKESARDTPPHVGRTPTEELKSGPVPLRQHTFRSSPPSDRVPWNQRLTAQSSMSPRALTQPKLSSSLLSEPTTRMRDRGGASTSNTTLPRDRRRRDALDEDLDQGDSTVPITNLPEKFSSPPLLFGLLQSVYEVLGPSAAPSPIQALSLKHLLGHPVHMPSKNKQQPSSPSLPAPSLPAPSPSAPPPSSPSQEFAPYNSSPAKYPWNQYLLASETGSGKSIAYLLPMLQYLKVTEHNPAPLPSDSLLPEGPVQVRPRGLILAPTHELSRQLSTFTKQLLHNIKLRVQCASQANTASSSHGTNSTASQLKRLLEANEADVEKTLSGGGEESGSGEELIFERRTHGVDILVGTPSRLLEMVRGIGWDLKDQIQEDWDEARKQRARDWVPGPPKLSLRNVEWIVVDEADILFHTEFERVTRSLLADIAQARGYTHPSFSDLKSAIPLTLDVDVQKQKPLLNPINYPFHLLLTSATIPLALGAYLTQNHPKLTRLASPQLHQLPKTLNVEYCNYTSGNKNAEVDKRVKALWSKERNAKIKSKILIFCNKSTKVEELREFLEERGVKCLALTGSSSTRSYNSNRHLAGFLKGKGDSKEKGAAQSSEQYPLDPKILITTSLLSRGLDFSPSIKYVFILDEPRNMIDFLHRAGRSGRAGNEGHVFIFTKLSGRGSESGREMMKKVEALT